VTLSFEQHRLGAREYSPAFVISLLLHLVVFSLLVFAPTKAPEPTILNVELVPQSFFSPAPKQIVSDSQVTLPQPPPPNTTQLASRDSFVEREQVQRGDGGGVPGQQEKMSQQSAPQAERVANQKRAAAAAKQDRRAEPKAVEHTQGPLRDLVLNPAEVVKDVLNPEREPLEERTQQEPRRSSTAAYRAFSRPQGSGAAFIGRGGVADLLPNLPDGDITMLNAKADQYAVFVRRVASQVFGQLRTSGWQSLTANDIRSLQEFTEVRAQLSPQGELMRVTLTSSSGSVRFDEVVKLSAQKGARDPNPPAGAAASDGTIKFIFRAKSWVQYGGNPRNGAPVERRWLLLATGLE
jgi:hypothetical protein